MAEVKESIIGNKSYSFALAVANTYKLLTNTQKEFVLSKQLLRSGTSIGANVREALAAESKKDFIHKLHISLKEARETSYWLNLLKDSSYLDELSFVSLQRSCDELIRILSSIIITTKERYIKTLNSQF